MTRSIAAIPVCSRSGTDRYTNPVASKTTSVAVEPVCRRVSGTQTVVPRPSN